MFAVKALADIKARCYCGGKYRRTKAQKFAKVAVNCKVNCKVLVM